jgi:hypothetical protein
VTAGETLARALHEGLKEPQVTVTPCACGATLTALCPRCGVRVCHGVHLSVETTGVAGCVPSLVPLLHINGFGLPCLPPAGSS